MSHLFRVLYSCRTILQWQVDFLPRMLGRGSCWLVSLLRILAILLLVSRITRNVQTQYFGWRGRKPTNLTSVLSWRSWSGR